MNNNHNQKLMRIIKQLHGLLETDDISQQRKSQNRLGNIYAANKNFSFNEHFVNTIHCEWTSYVHGSSDSSVILYCHGGGYITGSSLYARGLTTKLAQYSNLPVLAFDYRLAPEHPFPAALEDAVTVWNFLLTKGFPAQDIIIAGDSAGGNLALSLSLFLKNHELPMPKCLLLFSPWTDLSASGETYYTKSAIDPVLSNNYLQKACKAYVGSYTVDHPYISPLMADLHGLPPVFIQVGENEILLSDPLLLNQKLLNSNVNSHIDIYTHMWHVFQLCPIRSAHDAIKKITDTIKL